jgi:hypothetical protein
VWYQPAADHRRTVVDLRLQRASPERLHDSESLSLTAARG